MIKTENINNPELLIHPNIPKPLHGLNPRVIMGRDWWEIKRKEAYQRNDYHCYACGVHKFEAKYHRWLEAHESYQINYENGIMELKEIVALCHSCHNFIHSSRLWILFAKGEISRKRITDILLHGFAILKENNLKPFYATAFIWLALKGYSERQIRCELDKRNIKQPDNDFASWNQWRLIIDDKEYFSKFKNFEEWKAFYEE